MYSKIDHKIDMSQQTTGFVMFLLPTQIFYKSSEPIAKLAPYADFP